MGYGRRNGSPAFTICSNLCLLGVVLEHPGALLCPLPLGLFFTELGLQEVHLRLHRDKKAGTRR
jgi:hypothetical protein